MRGLIIKDFLLLRKTVSWYYLFPIAVFVVSCFHNLGLLSMLLSIGCFFITGNLAITTLLLDFQYKWETTIRSLPVSATKTILAKYIFTVSMLLLVLIVVLVVELVLTTVFDLPVIIVVFAVAIGISSTLLFCSAIFPLLYRYGPIKMQIAVISYTAVMLLVMMLANYMDLPNNLEALFANAIFLAAGVVIVSAGIFFLSIFASIRFFETAFITDYKYS